MEKTGLSSCIASAGAMGRGKQRQDPLGRRTGSLAPGSERVRLGEDIKLGAVKQDPCVHVCRFAAVTLTDTHVQISREKSNILN